MDQKALFDGLLMFVGFIMIVTFHEFGHAWTAWKLGDDTAKEQGRVTMNPAAHIDFFGTIFLPVLAVLMGACGMGPRGMLFGWGRPVPVNPSNLKRRRLYDTLITAAGPFMNIVLAVLVLAIVRFALPPGNAELREYREFGIGLAELSLFLFYLNLIPIPPLDGGHILRNLLCLSEEAFLRFSQYGIILVIVIINVRGVQLLLARATDLTLNAIAYLLGF
jgi:Zn-dependent protease